MRKLALCMVTVCLFLNVGVGRAQGGADTIFYNGKILTVDEGFTIAQAVAVARDRIVAVGSNPEVLELAGAGTLKIDLKGRTVTPGLIHTHLHLESPGRYGRRLPAGVRQQYPLNFRIVDGKEDVLKQISDTIRAVGFEPGQWIQFTTNPRGDQAAILFDELNRWELDKAAPENPIFVSLGVPILNMVLINSKAIEALWDKHGDFVETYGRYWVDEKGRPEGHLEAPAARVVVQEFAPEPDVQVMAPLYRKSLEERAAQGITTISGGLHAYCGKSPELTIGLDLGEETSYYVMLNGEGEVVEEGRIRTGEAELGKHFRGRGRARVALEAGSQSGWMARLLESWGHEVIVANPRQLRLIYENRRKDDRVDAQYLARVARLDPQLLSPVRLRGEQTQRDRVLLRSRENLVESRTKLINGVRSMLKQFGIRVNRCSSESFARRVGEQMSGEWEEMLGGVVEVIEVLTEKIRAYDGRIQQWGEQRYPPEPATEPGPRSGSVDGTGLRADGGAAGSLCQQPDGGGLPGSVSRTRSIRGAGSAVEDQQAGRSDAQTADDQQCALHPGALWAGLRVTPLWRTDRGRGVQKTPRNERWWRWPGNSRCYCWHSGEAGRHTIRFTTRIEVWPPEPWTDPG